MKDKMKTGTETTTPATTRHIVTACENAYRDQQGWFRKLPDGRWVEVGESGISDYLQVTHGVSAKPDEKGVSDLTRCLIYIQDNHWLTDDAKKLFGPGGKFERPRKWDCDNLPDELFTIVDAWLRDYFLRRKPGADSWKGRAYMLLQEFCQLPAVAIAMRDVEPHRRGRHTNLKRCLEVMEDLADPLSSKIQDNHTEWTFCRPSYLKPPRTTEVHLSLSCLSNHPNTTPV